MRKLMVLQAAVLATLASTGAWADCPSGTIAQGVDQNNNPLCVIANVGGGNGGGSPSPTNNTPSGGASSAVVGGGANAPKSVTPEKEYLDQCMTHLTDLGTAQLQAQLYKDKAVTRHVRTHAQIGKGELGPSCVKACKDFASVSHDISWGHSVYITDSAMVMDAKYAMKDLPPLPMPDKAELAACLPKHIIASWCPKSGSGVGAGPSRIENPLDKTMVCISGGDALNNMNFSDADAAHNCARPSIVDADERIKAEQKCSTDATAAAKPIPPAARPPPATAALPASVAVTPPPAPRKH